MNAGKSFEQQIKSSIPEECFYHRIKDSTGTFSGGANLRFSAENPFDALLFDCSRGILYALELKSTKAKSFSFEDPFVDEKQATRMIHKHQIRSLIDADRHDRVVGGFLFNFRDEGKNEERTYFQHIGNFVDMIQSCGKHSFNEKDLLAGDPVVIRGEKKRVKYRWNIEEFLKEMSERI